MTKLSLQFSGKCFQQLCWVIWVSIQKKKKNRKPDFLTLSCQKNSKIKIPKCVIDQNMKAETVKLLDENI